MIYIIGDTHGKQDRFDHLKGEKLWTAGDYLIICGDFGYVFQNNKSENLFLDELEKKPYTICFCDGNNENFDALCRYPKVPFCGGFAHRIRENIYHLKRGQIYDIDGLIFFTMGGAYSIDRFLRIEGLSWWRQELPSRAEQRFAERNLAEHGNKVDYIVTHTAPSFVISALGGYPAEEERELTDFFEKLSKRVCFKKLFFGHWHKDGEIGQMFRPIYLDVVAIDPKSEKEC